MSSGSRCHILKKLVLAIQRLDVCRSHLGLDQHQDYPWDSLLPRRDADRFHPAAVGQGPDGPAAQTRSGKLSGPPPGPSSISLDTAILRKQRAVNCNRKATPCSHSRAWHSWRLPLTADCSRLTTQEVNMLDFLLELWSFMTERNRFWLLPIIFCLVLLGSLIVFTSGSAVAPFIYTLF